MRCPRDVWDALRKQLQTFLIPKVLTAREEESDFLYTASHSEHMEKTHIKPLKDTKNTNKIAIETRLNYGMMQLLPSAVRSLSFSHRYMLWLQLACVSLHSTKLHFVFQNSIKNIGPH